MNKTGICKLCGEVRPFVKAHILPRSFYPKNPNGDIHQLVLSLDGATPKSRLKNGVFDGEMVCQSCESLFDPYDAYALNFFRKIKNTPTLVTPSGGHYREIREYDERKLKLFFISLLWRAHATTQLAFKQVRLGPYAKIAEQLIIEGNAGTNEQFKVVVMTIRDDGSPISHTKISTSPVLKRIDGIIYYEFVFYGIVAHIKVSTSPGLKAFDIGCIQKNNPLIVLEHDSISDVHTDAIKKAVKLASAFSSRNTT